MLQSLPGGYHGNMVTKMYLRSKFIVHCFTMIIDHKGKRFFFFFADQEKPHYFIPVNMYIQFSFFPLRKKKG